MYRIDYLPLAKEDITDAVEFLAIKMQSPKSAQTLLDKLDETVKLISEYPYAFELYRTDRPFTDEVRKVTVHKYVLYYAVFKDYVEIRRLIHGKKDRTDLCF